MAVADDFLLAGELAFDLNALMRCAVEVLGRFSSHLDTSAMTRGGCCCSEETDC